MAKTASKTPAPAKKAAPAKTPKAAKAAMAQPVAKKTAAAPAPAAPRMSAVNRAILDAAHKGRLPPAPDFTANTHKPYRAKLAVLTTLVKKRDLAGLQAIVINPTSTSPKAMIRYQTAALIALRARAAKKTG